MASARSWLVSKVLFPIFHYMKNDGLLPAVNFLEKAQWDSPENLRKMQASKLSKLLLHCSTHVPYYRDLFDQAGLSESVIENHDGFKRIPFLTKKNIVANKDSLIADNVARQDLVKNSTSGSTGEPMVFFNDRRALKWHQAVVLRNQKWVGALYSGREMRLWGAQIDLKKVESIRGRFHSWLHQKVFLSSYELSDDSMSEYAKIMERFKPELLISYPSPLATFAKYLQRKNININYIHSIITSAEKLHDWQRTLIEEVFDTDVFDRYGCREFGNIAHECSAHEGYHINAERFFIEILDGQGEPVAPGELGTLYITDLDNYGFPFIRYKIGDLAVQSSKLCSCGRGLPLIESIEGRAFDIIECPNGNRIAGTYWTIMLRTIPGVDRFQIEQVLADSLIVRIIKNEEYNQLYAEEKIQNIVHDKCGSEMLVKVEYVEHIPLTGSGKEKMVISMVS